MKQQSQRAYNALVLVQPLHGSMSPWSAQPLVSCLLSHWPMQGVVVKGSLHLETLGHVTCITFDKSGTLTQGQFAVVNAELASGSQQTAAMPLHRMLSLAAAVEAHSTHPLAPAIIGYAAAQHGYTR